MFCCWDKIDTKLSKIFRHEATSTITFRVRPLVFQFDMPDSSQRGYRSSNNKGLSGNHPIHLISPFI